MSTKRKVSTISEQDVAASKRKPNGIKGVTIAEKSNDSLRDELIETLRKSGIHGVVESKIVFAHTGLYVNSYLFGWVGPGGFCIRCKNATQKKICVSFGCFVMEEGNHKNYYTVPESVHKDRAKFRELAEHIVDMSHPVEEKVKTAMNARMTKK